MRADHEMDDNNNEGRDIPPDEDRLNYWQERRNNLPISQQASDDPHREHDLAEDCGTPSPSVRSNIGVNTRTNHYVQEPLDSSSDAVPSIHNRVFRPERQQRHNGTQYYNSEANRLTTFSDWRYERIIRREDLARNGFIYTGTADKVSIET
jgi:hypothetical protein